MAQPHRTRELLERAVGLTRRVLEEEERRIEAAELACEAKPPASSKKQKASPSSAAAPSSVSLPDAVLKAATPSDLAESLADFTRLVDASLALGEIVASAVAPLLRTAATNGLLLLLPRVLEARARVAALQPKPSLPSEGTLPYLPSRAATLSLQLPLFGIDERLAEDALSQKEPRQEGQPSAGGELPTTRSCEEQRRLVAEQIRFWKRVFAGGKHAAFSRRASRAPFRGNVRRNTERRLRSRLKSGFSTRACVRAESLSEAAEGSSSSVSEEEKAVEAVAAPLAAQSTEPPATDTQDADAEGGGENILSGQMGSGVLDGKPFVPLSKNFFFFFCADGAAAGEAGGGEKEALEGKETFGFANADAAAKAASRIAEAWRQFSARRLRRASEMKLFELLGFVPSTASSWEASSAETLKAEEGLQQAQTAALLLHAKRREEIDALLEGAFKERLVVRTRQSLNLSLSLSFPPSLSLHRRLQASAAFCAARRKT